MVLQQFYFDNISSDDVNNKIIKLAKVKAK
jgi:hypothetical protein